MKILMIAMTWIALSAGEATSPYAGEEQRIVKALSAERIDAYRSGRGMGYAKAAELNHYPGPRHVLDLARELDLSDEQRDRTEALFEAMQERASSLGEELVAREADLDRAFAEGSIDPETLQRLVGEIAALEGEIRYTHLVAHLRQREVLSEAQARRYDQLRGYHGAHAGH